MSWFSAAVARGGVWSIVAIFAVGFSPLILMAYLRGVDVEERRTAFIARCVADRGEARSYECEALFAIAEGKSGNDAGTAALVISLVNSQGTTR